MTARGGDWASETTAAEDLLLCHRGEVEIRPAGGPLELDAIASGLPDRSAEQHRGRYEAQAGGRGIYLIAWERDKPVGHVMLKWPWWPERHVSEITARHDCSWVEDLAVQAEYRNRGIAGTVMRELEALTRAHGLDRIGLTVGVDEGYAAARHLYDSLGYRDPGHGAFMESAAIPGGGIWMDWVIVLIKELR
jgi:GNAT superfamily N-acetyltransferase